MGKHTVWMCLLFPAFATCAHADYLYSFTFTPETIAFGTVEIESFSFSFTVPNFVAAGQSPAFSSFTLTDGTNTSIPITMALADTDSSGGCFDFISASNAFFGTNCGGGGMAGVAILTSDGAGFFAPISLPTAVGTYNAGGAYATFFHGDSKSGLDQTDGSVSLVVSETSPTSAPEPTTVSLLASLIILMGIAYTVATRRRSTR